MAYEESLLRFSMPVAANESTAQYKFFKVGSNGQMTVCGNGDPFDGVLQDNPNTTGFVGEFGFGGVSKILVGSAGVTAGDAVQSDSTGAAVTQSSTGVTNGRALASGVSGDIIPVLLKAGINH